MKYSRQSSRTHTKTELNERASLHSSKLLISEGRLLCNYISTGSADQALDI